MIWCPSVTSSWTWSGISGTTAPKLSKLRPLLGSRRLQCFLNLRWCQLIVNAFQNLLAFLCNFVLSCHETCEHGCGFFNLLHSPLCGLTLKVISQGYWKVIQIVIRIRPSLWPAAWACAPCMPENGRHGEKRWSGQTTKLAPQHSHWMSPLSAIDPKLLHGCPGYPIDCCTSAGRSGSQSHSVLSRLDHSRTLSAIHVRISSSMFQQYGVPSSSCNKA